MSIDEVPYRIELSLVAALKLDDDEALIAWATRRLESLPGVFVQGASSERMDANDVIADSPLDRRLKP